MTAIAQPALIKRIDPDAASTPAAGLNLWARIALWTILAFSACSLLRVVMDGEASPQLASIAPSQNMISEVQHTISHQGHARRKAATGLSRPISSVAHNPVVSDSRHLATRKALAIPFEYQDAAGQLSLRLGYYGAAVSYFTEAIEKYPQDGQARDQRAEVYWRTGQYALAAYDFENALRTNPQDTTAMKGLSWLLSSGTARSGRDRKRAIALAQQVCILSGWHDTAAIETLAAAYASAGAFDKAIKTQGQAIAMLHESSRSALRLALYAQHRTVDSTEIPQL